MSARPVYLNEILCSPKVTRITTIKPENVVSLPFIPKTTPLVTGPQPVTNRPKKSEIIRKIEWFYFFVPKEHAMGLSEVIPNYNTKFLVCAHFPGYVEGKTTKMFAAFETYLDFINYIRDVSRQSWNFFEIILGSRPQKLYVDIDISEDYVPIGESLESFSKRLLDVLIDRIVEVFRNVLNVEFDMTRHLLLFSSHGSGKKSFHIVIDKYCVSGYGENRDLMREILKTIPSEFIEVQSGASKGAKIIDIGLYSSKQQFRLYGSQKTGSNRPKIFMNEFEHRGQYYYHKYDIPPMTDIQRSVFEFTLIFQKSCVTFVDGCTFVSVNNPDDPEFEPGRHKLWSEKGAFDDLPTVSPEVMHAAIEQVQDKINMHVWSIGESGNGVINLRRKTRAFCNICDREHDNENAFVSVHPKWGHLYFHCWREIDTGGKRSTKIGEVDTGYNESISSNHVNQLMKQMRMKVSQQTAVQQPVKLVVMNPLGTPFTGSVRKFVQNMATGRGPSYF